MYITAQRVRSPGRARRDGVNTYLHQHGAISWPKRAEEVLELIETNPGEPVDSALNLTPVGGNDVLAYLDVIAPDGTSRSKLVEAIDALFQVGGAEALVALSLGSVVVRLGIAKSLKSRWQEELESLAGAVEDLLRRERRLKVGRPSKVERKAAGARSRKQAPG